MARKFRRRFNGGRRRRFRTRRFTRKIVKVARRTIRRMHEIKRSYSLIAIPAAIGDWQVDEITPVVSQGVNKNQRIGNKIQYRFFTINIQLFNLNVDTAVSVHSSFVRVTLFTARNNLVVGMADILEDGITIPANDQNIFLPFRSENVNVLMDRKFTMGSAANQNTLGGNQATNLPYIRTIKFSKMIRRNVTYKDATANVPSQPQDQLYIVIGNSNPDTNLFGNVSTRMSYIDL